MSLHRLRRHPSPAPLLPPPLLLRWTFRWLPLKPTRTSQSSTTIPYLSKIIILIIIIAMILTVLTVIIVVMMTIVRNRILFRTFGTVPILLQLWAEILEEWPWKRAKMLRNSLKMSDIGCGIGVRMWWNSELNGNVLLLVGFIVFLIGRWGNGVEYSGRHGRNRQQYQHAARNSRVPESAFGNGTDSR